MSILLAPFEGNVQIRMISNPREPGIRPAHADTQFYSQRRSSCGLLFGKAPVSSKYRADKRVVVSSYPDE
jgi:hypothetical protein